MVFPDTPLRAALIALVLPCLLSACAGWGSARSPKTLGEETSGYTYIPVDPIAIEEISGRYCEGVDEKTLRSRDFDGRFVPFQYQSRRDAPDPQVALAAVPVFRQLLDSFPDNAVRISVEQYDSRGNVRYGPSSVGTEGERYRVTVDYINADTTTIPLIIRKQTPYGKVGVTQPVSELEGPVTYFVERANGSSITSTDGELFNVPLYIGLGLRVTADINVHRSDAKIEGLGVIGAEAEAGNLSGSLVVQTLGVNGKSISAALPIQSELNRTTAQNAIVAIGSIKALLYEAETIVSPRVVGLYLPFPGGKDLVNKIISVLAEQPIPWKRPCERAVDERGREKAQGNTGE